MNIDFLIKKYNKLFGKKKLYLVKVPLRISPVGAHIDHQLGIVSGMIVDNYMYFLFGESKNKRVRVYSENYNSSIEFFIDDKLEKENNWSDYIKGAVSVLKENFRIEKGIDGIICSDVSTGGMSSSAATGISYLFSLEKVNGIEVDKKTNIYLMQKIENDFIGLNNGILDQSVILLNSSNRSSLFFIDCKTLEYKNICPEKKINFGILVVHSGINRVLLNTNYNERVKECLIVAKKILELAGEQVKEDVKLRDVPREYFEKFKDKLPENLRKRGQHFYSEMERVEKGIGYWRKGDMVNFGELIKMSGESSIKNYECGIPETIYLQKILNSIPEIYGSRFSGAGFGGSCIGLIKEGIEKEKIIENIGKKYLCKFPYLKDKYKIIFTKHGRAPEIINF